MTRDSGQLAVHHRGLSKPVVQARLLLHRAVMNQLRYAVTTLSMQPVKYPSPLCLPSQRQGTHEQWVSGAACGRQRQSCRHSAKCLHARSCIH